MGFLFFFFFFNVLSLLVSVMYYSLYFLSTLQVASYSLSWPHFLPTALNVDVSQVSAFGLFSCLTVHTLPIYIRMYQLAKDRKKYLLLKISVTQKIRRFIIAYSKKSRRRGHKRTHYVVPLIRFLE